MLGFSNDSYRPLGRYHPCEVTKHNYFGECVELEPGFAGLLHIAELADEKVDNQLVREIGTDAFDIALSLSLYLQYQDVSSRLIESTFGTSKDVRDFLDYIVKVSKPQVIHYLWRPYLPDPDDDMVLELAVASNSQSIVTFNKRDFDGAEDFACRVESPLEFLKRLGILP